MILRIKKLYQCGHLIPVKCHMVTIEQICFHSLSAACCTSSRQCRYGFICCQARSWNEERVATWRLHMVQYCTITAALQCQLAPCIARSSAYSKTLHQGHNDSLCLQSIRKLKSLQVPSTSARRSSHLANITLGEMRSRASPPGRPYTIAEAAYHICL